MNEKEQEEYLFKIVDKILFYLDIKMTDEEKANLVMGELLDIKKK